MTTLETTVTAVDAEAYEIPTDRPRVTASSPGTRR